MIFIATKMLQLSSFPNVLFGADKQGELVCVLDFTSCDILAQTVLKVILTVSHVNNIN